MSRMVVQAVAGLTALFMVGTLVCVFNLFNDINTFYDEALKDLEEFKVWLL